MRIGFFTDSYWPARHGVQASIDSFADNLEKMGHEVFIYTTHSPGYVDSRPRVTRLKAIKVINNPEMRMALPFVHDGELSSIIKSKLDIVHAHTPFGIGLLGKFIAKFQDAPVVYTHHTDYAEYAKFYLKEKLIFPHLTKRYTSWFCNSSDAVIAPSEKIRHMLLGYKVKTPIFTVPTGIDLSLFAVKADKKNISSLRKRLGIKEGEKIILSLGRLGKEKNVDFILKAFAENERLRQKARFIIAGLGSGLDQLKKSAEKLKLSDRVIFPGFVPEEEKNLYYRMADVFAFASRTDTQGIVLLEAMANHLPVVAIRDDAFSGTVIDGKNGYLVEPDSSAEFGEKLLDIVSDGGLGEKFGSAGRLIAEQFSDSEQTKKLAGIYESLLGKQ